MKKSLLCVLLILAGCGGTNPALEYIKTTTRNLQPVVDKTEEICNLSRNAPKLAEQDTVELEKRCDELWEILKLVQKMQETAILMAGGGTWAKCAQSSKTGL